MQRTISSPTTFVGLATVAATLSACGYLDQNWETSRAAFVGTFECPNCTGTEDPKFGSVAYRPSTTPPNADSCPTPTGRKRTSLSSVGGSVARVMCKHYDDPYCDYLNRRQSGDAITFDHLLFDRCGAGHARACVFRALLYAKGYGVDADRTCAERLAHEACEDGYRPGCRYHRNLTTPADVEVDTY